MAFDTQQERVFEQMDDAFRCYGYYIASDPIDGMEEVFLDDLRDALRKIEDTAAWLRRKYGYRGVSKRLLEGLHDSLPSPSFNVESDASVELEGKEQSRKM